MVKATDGGGRSCQADVLLLVQDANDNPPRFSRGNLRVTIFDNTTVGAPVAVLRASDPDTGQTSGLCPLLVSVGQRLGGVKTSSKS